MNTIFSKTPLTIDAVEDKRDRLAVWVKWCLVAGVAICLAPFAFTVLSAMVALLVTSSLALLAVTFAPVAALKLANWRMSEVLDEIRTNPIVTLERQLLNRRTVMREARVQLAESLAKVESFVDQAQKAALRYPDLATRWTQRSEKARTLAGSKKRSYRLACSAVDAFEDEVEHCRTEWALIVASNGLTDSLEDCMGSPLDQLCKRTAVQSVTDEMNQAFADLEIELLHEADAIDGRLIHRKG